MENRPNKPERSGPSFPKDGADQSFWSFLRRHADKLVGAGLVLSFALGFLGYYQFLPKHSEDWSWSDVVYNTLQLFILEVARDTDSPEKWNWMIHVARFTAPGFVAWSAIQIFLVNIKSLNHSRRRSALKNHYVVIGTGHTAVRLARSLLKDDSKVVHLQGVGATSLAEVAGRPHLFPVSGDFTNPDVLKVARVHWAQKVVIASGNDNENVRIAESIRDWSESRRPERKLVCHLEMSPGPSSPLHREEAAKHLRTERLEPRLFQPQRIAARELIMSHPPHHGRCPGTSGSVDGPPLHALVVGFEPFGKEVVKQLIRVCHYLDRKRVRITIVAENAQRDFKRFKKEVPALALVADVKLHSADPSAVTGADWNEMQGRGDHLMGRSGDFDIVYITTSDTEDAYSVAMDAMDGLGTPAEMEPQPESGTRPKPDLQQGRPEKVILCSATRLLGKSDQIERFDPEEESWTAAHLLRNDPDRVARKIHERYHEKNCDETDPGKRQALKPWDDLPEHDRDANRDQADHIAVKLLLFGLSGQDMLWHVPELTRSIEAEVAGLERDEAQSKAGKRLALTRAFDEFSRKHGLPDIEALAEVEHRRWMATKALAGYAKGENNKPQRLHPDMVPYGELDSPTKEKDRDVIRDLPIDLLNFQEAGAGELGLGK